MHAGLQPHALSLILIPVVFAAAAVQTQCPWDPVGLSLRFPGACALPIDDSNDAVQPSEQNKSIPWTHHPRCVVPSSVGLTDKFCVYSSSAFNGASGLSIIATPDTAAGLVAAVQDPLPAWRARRHLASRGHLQTETYDLPYTVVPIPGKGLGVVATRHIRQFETIMTSFPALIVDNVFFPPGESEGPAEGPALFQTALGQLTDKERFLTLSRSKGGDTHVVEDVVRTNSFGITLDGRGVKGLYPEIAVRVGSFEHPWSGLRQGPKICC